MIFVGDTNNRRVVYPIIVLVILFGFYLRVSNVFDQVPCLGKFVQKIYLNLDTLSKII